MFMDTAGGRVHPCIMLTRHRTNLIRLPLSSMCLLMLSLGSVSFALAAVTRHVGPGHPFLNIGDVPWESLAPGDSVLIHARPAPSSISGRRIAV